MRNLVFRNLTSRDRRRKMISSQEVINKPGVRSVVQRHFVCILKEMQGEAAHRPAPYLYVLKEHNSKDRIEKFFCKIKGNMYVVNNNKLFLVLFMHSLKISLTGNSLQLGHNEA